jgi:hypothetical protein
VRSGPREPEDDEKDQGSLMSLEPSCVGLLGSSPVTSEENSRAITKREERSGNRSSVPRYILPYRYALEGARAGVVGCMKKDPRIAEFDGEV